MFNKPFAGLSQELLITTILTLDEVSSELLYLDSLSPELVYAPYLLMEGYAGDFGIVERASDNTQLSIGFNDDRMVDTAALATFLTSTTGEWVQMNDQSGNGRNATRAFGTAPDAGTRVVNGVTVPDFNGTTQEMGTDLDFIVGSQYTMIGCAEFDDTGINFIFGGKDTGTANADLQMGVESGATTVALQQDSRGLTDPLNLSQTINTGEPYIYTGKLTGTGKYLRVNKGTAATDSVTDTVGSIANERIMWRGEPFGTDRYANGAFCGLIGFDSALSVSDEESVIDLLAVVFGVSL